MPWRAKRKPGSQSVWIVIESETGEVVAEHDSEEEAQEHVKALYANTEEEER